MKPFSGRQFCRLLERNGWSLLRIDGSHHVYGKPGHRISVPVHGRAALKRGLQHRLTNSPASIRMAMARDPPRSYTVSGQGGARP